VVEYPQAGAEPCADDHRELQGNAQSVQEPALMANDHGLIPCLMQGMLTAA